MDQAEHYTLIPDFVLGPRFEMSRFLFGLFRQSCRKTETTFVNQPLLLFQNLFSDLLDEHRKITIERLVFPCTVVRARTQFIPAPLYVLAPDEMMQLIECPQIREISETIWFQTAESSRANP